MGGIIQDAGGGSSTPGDGGNSHSIALVTIMIVGGMGCVILALGCALRCYMIRRHRPVGISIAYDWQPPVQEITPLPRRLDGSLEDTRRAGCASNFAGHPLQAHQSSTHGHFAFPIQPAPLLSRTPDRVNENMRPPRSGGLEGLREGSIDEWNGNDRLRGHGQTASNPSETVMASLEGFSRSQRRHWMMATIAEASRDG